MAAFAIFAALAVIGSRARYINAGQHNNT